MRIRNREQTVAGSKNNMSCGDFVPLLTKCICLLGGLFLVQASSSGISSLWADENARAEQYAGPFLGNGIRNGWADQNSIVIWTRTTRAPEILADGKPFVSIPDRRAREMARLTDPEALLLEQLPEGAVLDEMLGACPGASGQVRINWHPADAEDQIRSSEWVTTTAERDFTAQWKLRELHAGTEYLTLVETRGLDGERGVSLRGSFRTPPESDDPESLRFCITTCHDFIRRDNGMSGHRIYPSMTQLNPHFVVHAGDIEYYDKPDPWALTKELMRFKWQRIFALPDNRRFYSNTTSYFIKDDHDTLSNDSWPGRTYGAVSFEEGVRLFNDEQFPTRNPRYTSVRWGRDLEIWILEGRDFRSPNNMPDGPDKTILGAEQKAWLLNSLANSDATFKLVCSPTPIVGPDRKNKSDNHANDVFAHEGQQLRDAMSAIPGVIVFCGDRHWQYASCDANTGLWEFGCGPGSEKHELGWKAGDIRPTHRFLRVRGGFLSGELRSSAGQAGELILRHHSVDGDEKSCFAFPQSWEGSVDTQN